VTILDDSLILAPMAGVSTPALRILIEEFGGCDLYFTEMISSAALIQGGPYEASYIAADPDPDRLIHQLVGFEEASVVRAAEYLDGLPGFGVDFNMGCSAPDIVRAGGGVAWMRGLAAALRRAVKGKRLSVKLRVGFEDDYPGLLRFCRGLQEEGVDFITLHPRLKKEKFGRLARWDYVGALKRDLSIPVVGNGDIRSFDDYREKKEEHRPDGIMVGRSAARAPWFFAFLRRREREPHREMVVDLEETAGRFLDLLPRHQPADFLESRAKRFFGYFCGNLLFGQGLFTRLNRAPGFSGVEKVVREYFRERPEVRWKTEKK